MKYTNTTIWAIMAILLLPIAGCEDAFFENEQTLTKIDSEEEINILINGTYKLLLGVYNQDYFRHFEASDEFRHWTGNDTEVFLGRILYTCDIKNGPQPNLDNFYKGYYKTLVTINRLIPVLTQSVHPRLTELYFLRAYCYYQLVRLYGDIPLILDIDVTYQLEKSSSEEIYHTILSDLSQAETILKSTANEKISIGTVKSLKAEVYLTMAGWPLNKSEYYAQAAKIAKEVIDNAGTFNYALNEDFSNIWKIKSNNEEIVFEISSEDNTTTFTNESFQHPWSYSYLPSQGYYFSKWGYFQPELAFLTNFPDSYRKFQTFYSEAYMGLLQARTDPSIPDYESISTHLILNPLDHANPQCNLQEYITYTKFFDLQLIGYESHLFRIVNNSINTIPLLRYAHVLLTYAEAKARSGQLDQSAYDALNQVRRRANFLPLDQPSDKDLMPGLAAATFADSVVWERAWEFCMEPQGRWFDIVRLQLLDELEAIQYPDEAQTTNFNEIYDDTGYHARIPKTDKRLNEILIK